MRVLMLNHEFPPVGGGAGNATRHLTTELARLGVDTTVLTGSFNGQPRRESVDGVHIVRLPSLRRHRLEASPLEIASYTVSAAVAALGCGVLARPDLVHAFFGLPGGAIAYGLKKALNLPYIVSFRGRDVHGGKHASEQGIGGMMKRASLPVWRGADRLVANSRGLRDIANQVEPEVQIDVIPNGVDVRRFSPLKSKSHVVRVLFVGRLEPYKGLEDLLKAVCILQASNIRGFSVEIVGQGSLEGKLRHRIAEWGIGSHVRMAGQVLPDQMADVYRDADLFVLPSHVEGMSNAILEAMASGLPIVATKIAGSEELITEGVDGHLVEPSSPEQLGQALARLMNSKKERMQLGTAARESAKRRSWGGVARDYLQAYQCILEGASVCAVSSAS